MKKNNDRKELIKGVVYTVTHLPSGMKYVGVTTDNMEKRKKDHIQKALNGTGHQFQNAIATYGPDNFKWEEIDSAGSIEELARLEKNYIQEFDSHINGFNSDSGGSLRKPVYQFNKNGNLVKVFSDLRSAADTVGVNPKSISAACLGKIKMCRGFYWSYSLVDLLYRTTDVRTKTVQQFDLEGNFISKFKSIVEASQKTGVNKSCIAKCRRGERKTAGGFIWF